MKHKKSYFAEAAKLAATKTVVAENETHVSEEDRVLAEAIAKVDHSKVHVTEAEDGDGEGTQMDDKGVFGGRQIEFAQDVYHLPKKPSGDVSQPIGLLTQADLNNYVVFRKGDRLTMKYKSGDAGNCQYEAKKNGHDKFSCDFDWTDALIQELIDEGACKQL